MMLSVILVFMLMILHSTLILMRHLICCNNKEFAGKLDSDLRDTLTAIGLFISMLEKLDLFRLIDLMTLVQLI